MNVDDIYTAAMGRCIWPLMNLANRRSIHQKMVFLEKSQYFTSDQLQQVQLEKLRRLLAHACDNVPFYRAQMKKLGLNSADLNNIEDMRLLPTVSKSLLKTQATYFLTDGERFSNLVMGQTSGSTGQPTQFYRSREQDSWHWALKYRMWGMAGYRLGMPYVNIYNMRRLGWKKNLQDRLLRNRAVYLYGDCEQQQLLENVLAALQDARVQFLAGCTSSIRMFVDYCNSLNTAPSFSLRAILTTGSLLSHSDRALFEKTLGAPVWDHYGLGGEGADVAAECEVKNGYHINSENLLIEPSDPDAAACGEPTGILVTVLDNYAWPLIRYETGDAAVFTDRKCPCGRGLPLLERIDGRISEILTLPNGARLNVHFFSVLFGKSKQVAQYQVEQVAPQRLIIRVVWNPEASALEKSRIAAELDRVSSGTVDMRFDDVATIPLGKSGKHRYVIALQAQAA